jgi:hypothetical protein
MATNPQHVDINNLRQLEFKSSIQELGEENYLVGNHFQVEAEAYVLKQSHPDKAT